MLLAHLGVAVFIVGVTLVKGYETELDVQAWTRATASTVAGYEFRFDGVREIKGPNYTAQRADVERDAATATRLPRCIRRSASTTCSRCR